MARFVVTKIDQLINYLALAIMICGGLTLHILTSMTINSYFGTPWGYISFLLPGISEIYLGMLQISENMYNYMILLTGFIALLALSTGLCFISKKIRSKVAGAYER